MRIGEVAEIAGVTTRAIRHYHGVGLLPEPRRTAGGYRDYSGRDLLGLLRIVRLTSLGLSLDEVRAALADESGAELREILRAVAADLDQQLIEVLEHRRRIAVALAADDQLGRSPELAALIRRISDHLPDGPVVRQETHLLELFEASMTPDLFAEMTGSYHRLLDDGSATARAAELSERFTRLTDEPVDDPLVTQIIDEIVALGGSFLPATADGPQDGRAWRLFLESLTPAQRRCIEAAAARWGSS